MTATLKNGTLACLDVMERPNETSEAAHCWTWNGLIFNVKLQRFMKGGWRFDERKRESIRIRQINTGNEKNLYYNGIPKN